MKTVLLIMRRAALAQGLLQRLASECDLRMLYEPDYANSDIAIRRNKAQIAVIEITESNEYDADYCLDLCCWLRKITPSCKLLIMCPEGKVQEVEKVIRAKREKRIDDFVFYDVSMDYLVTNLRAL